MPTKELAAVSVGPSRDARTVVSLVLNGLVVGFFSWQLVTAIEAQRYWLAALSTAVLLISLVSAARWLFQLLSRETLSIIADSLQVVLDIRGWHHQRAYPLQDVAYPRIEERRYRGKHGSSRIHRFVFEYRGALRRNSRYLTPDEAEQVQKKLVLALGSNPMDDRK